jgi:hypothetical protein
MLSGRTRRMRPLAALFCSLLPCVPSRAQDYTISTYAGGGPQPTFNFDHPMGVAVDSAGNVYFAAGSAVFRTTAAGTAILVAGMAFQSGYSGDGGPATSALLRNPRGIAVDASGAIYIADEEGNCVRKVASDGKISTVAGNGGFGFSGDGGPANIAVLNYPSRVAVDAGGNLYIADSGNYRIRKVALDGTISTVAGNGSGGFSGDGGPATNAEMGPADIALDAAGNLYIADPGNNRIRRVALDGKISTVAGNGGFGYSGDGGTATRSSTA